MCLSLGKPQAPALLNRALLEAERVGNTGGGRGEKRVSESVSQ